MDVPMTIPSSPSPDEPTQATAQERAEAERAASSRDHDAGTKTIAYLFSGALVYGGIGWGLDRWLGTAWLMPVGIVAGMALSLYLIWFRYGTD